jgi:hypothetical protein
MPTDTQRTGTPTDDLGGCLADEEHSLDTADFCPMVAMYRASNYESRNTCILRMARKAFSTACNRRYSYRRKLKLDLAQEDNCLRARLLKTTRRNGLIALDKRVGDLSLFDIDQTSCLPQWVEKTESFRVSCVNLP